MAYTEHEWVNGETITAAKMNNIEEGIAEAAQSGGGGYDLVIRTSKHIAESLSDADLELVSGTWAEAMAKVKAGEPITAMCYWYYYNNDSEYGYFKFPLLGITADEGYHDCIEVWFLKSEVPSVTVRNATDTDGVTIYGTTRTYSHFYITESGVSLSAPWD